MSLGYVVKEKRQRSCPFKYIAPKRKRIKEFGKDLDEVLAASDKGSYFDQEMLLALSLFQVFG